MVPGGRSATAGFLRDRGSSNSFVSQHSYDSSDSISSAASSNAFLSNRFNNLTARPSATVGPASLLSPVADEVSAELSDSGLLGEDKQAIEELIEQSALKREQNSMSSIHSSTNTSSLNETSQANTVGHDEYTQNNFDT